MAKDDATDMASVQQVDARFQSNVSDMIRYMRFVGIWNIVFGAIYCLGIITAIIGVPVILMGMRAREAADAFNRYSSSSAFGDLSQAVDRQTRFFFIQYVFLIIGLVLFGIYVLVLLGGFLSGSFPTEI